MLNLLLINALRFSLYSFFYFKYFPNSLRNIKFRKTQMKSDEHSLEVRVEIFNS